MTSNFRYIIIREDGFACKFKDKKICISHNNYITIEI